MKLIIAGGGTGGHLFPAMAIAEEFKANDADNEVLFVGTKKGIEGRLLPKKGWAVKFISAEGIKGKGTFGMIRGVVKMIAGTIQSIAIVAGFRPGFILGVGGYASAPLVVAGRLFGIKAAIHEQNAIPGLANRFLGRFVNRVFLTYSGSERYFSAAKVFVTGNPVRKEILNMSDATVIESEREDAFTLLVFGGSHGARRINDVVSEMVASGALSKIKNLKVIHQTGSEDMERISKIYDEAGVDAEVCSFIEDMAHAYMKSSLVICRAGATTIAELLVAGKPAILVPYPYAADDHQRVNAESVAGSDAAVMLLEAEFSTQSLARRIMGIYEEDGKLAEMAENAKKLARRDAASQIYGEIRQMLN